MRSESILFFGATQLVAMLGMNELIVVLIASILAIVIVSKALADRRSVDMISWVTFAAAIASAIFMPLMMEAEEARGADYMMKVTVDGSTIEGKAIKKTSEQVTFVSRDGRLWRFPPIDATNVRKTAAGFIPLSPVEMRKQLLEEFGKRFDVTGTRHFLVVHPKGLKNQWASRFERIYGSFRSYFTTRGMKLRNPHYPLVAVVFPTATEFRRHAILTGVSVTPGVRGYYSPVSNRILLYDSEAADRVDWHTNASTIVHEVAHQVAFNVGVHSRLRMPPRWLAEGLGSMFEAPGVWRSERDASIKNRMNMFRCERFLRFAERRETGSLADFIANDRAFRRNSDTAYAESWALTFYLAETRPRQYARYLAATEAGRGGMSASGPERLKTFTDAFGANLDVLEKQYLQFYRKLAQEQMVAARR